MIMMAIIIKITNSKSFLCGGMEPSIKEEGVLDLIPVELIFISSSLTGLKISSCVISLLPETIAAKQSMDFVRSYFGTNEMKLTSDQLNIFFLTFFQISTDLEKKCLTLLIYQS